MKTATLSITVGHYDDSRCVYILPPLDGCNAVDQLQKIEMNGGEKDDQPITVRLASPQHNDDKNGGAFDNKHFVTQVNVPSTRKPCYGEPFSCKLVPDSFSETVALPVLPPSGPRHSCASFCNYESDKRYKASMTLEPSLAAIGFNVSMVCYQDSTKKNYRTTVLCSPRLRPKHFGDTSFIQPKRKETRFVAYVDCGADSPRKWHTTSVTVRPRTACSNFVRGFQLSDGTWSGEGMSDILDDQNSIGSSGFLEDENESFQNPSDLELHVRDEEEFGVHGYRAQMVVGGK